MGRGRRWRGRGGFRGGGRRAWDRRVESESSTERHEAVVGRAVLRECGLVHEDRCDEIVQGLLVGRGGRSEGAMMTVGQLGG